VVTGTGPGGRGASVVVVVETGALVVVSARVVVEVDEEVVGAVVPSSPQPAAVQPSVTRTTAETATRRRFEVVGSCPVGGTVVIEGVPGPASAASYSTGTTPITTQMPLSPLPSGCVTVTRWLVHHGQAERASKGSAAGSIPGGRLCSTSPFPDRGDGATVTSSR
jgi:hypothetical protein